MASFRKRTGKNGAISFRAEVRLKGAKPESATFKRLTDAKKWASSTESSIREGRYFKTAESRRHTISDLLNRYIQDVLPRKKPYVAKIQKAQILWWESQLGYLTLADITPALITEARDKLFNTPNKNEKKASPATVNRYIAALSHAFTIAVNEWGWLEDSPIRKISKLKESRGRTRFLADAERTELLHECRRSDNTVLYTIVVLALSTGMRSGEIMSLEWKNIDFPNRRITLYETKNNEIRTVPLSGHAFDLIFEHSKVRPINTNLLFPSQVDRMKPVDIRKAWNTVLKKSGIHDFRFHDLRHTAASYLAMNGASLTDISEILGHKTLQMVKRYAHLSEDHKSSVVASMNDKIFKTPGGGHG